MIYTDIAIPLGIGLGVVFGLILITLFTCVKIVSQAEEVIVERLGQYSKTWSSGLHIRAPFIDRISAKVTLKEQVKDFPPQGVISKDNVTMKVDAVIYLKVTDTKSYTYNVQRPLVAIENLAATTLRNVCGELTLDEMLNARDKINIYLTKELDEHTDPWGIKVIRVEVKNIMPPADVRADMEKQMRADREKRARILTAEGKKQAAILEAEGFKQSAILESQGKKEAVIQGAEAEFARMKLEAEALQNYFKVVNNANPTAASLKLKQLEALIKVSESKSNKIFIPTDIANSAITGTAWGAGRELAGE